MLKLYRERYSLHKANDRRAREVYRIARQHTPPLHPTQQEASHAR